MAEMMDVQSGILPMAPIPTGRGWKGIESENSTRKEGKKKDDKERLKPPGHDVPWGNLHSSSNYNESSTSIHRVTSNNGPPLDFGLSEGFGEFPQEMIPKSKPLDTDSSSPQPKRKGFSAYSYSYSYSYSRSPNASTSTSASTKKTDRPSSPSPPSGPSFGVALQQASHAECEPGTTSDLLSIVLGRQHANRPWQYALNYADFSLPVKIYWGQEDDKISEKSVRWMEKTMTSGVELLVLQGEGHNLMTSSGTMLSVFQSLREEISMAALGPQPDLRFY
jgi:pimeloyl-ACP methyl ester carboxylesterase